MALKRFKVGDLLKMDYGEIDKAVQQQLQRASLDCVENPTEGKARSVSIDMEIKPVTHGGQCTEVDLTVQISSKVPARTSRQYRLHADVDGDLKFNEASPDNPNQRTLDELGKSLDAADGHG